VWVGGAAVKLSTVAPGQSVCLQHVESIDEHEGTFTCYDVSLESGNRITVTGSHFFQLDCGRWVRVRNLTVGSRLKSRIGLVGVSGIAERTYTGKLYNLKVKDSEQYMVGKDGLIVRDW
jgi:hypothetical protein